MRYTCPVKYACLDGAAVLGNAPKIHDCSRSERNLVAGWWWCGWKLLVGLGRPVVFTLEWRRRRRRGSSKTGFRNQNARQRCQTRCLYVSPYVAWEAVWCWAISWNWSIYMCYLGAARRKLLLFHQKTGHRLSARGNGRARARPLPMLHTVSKRDGMQAFCQCKQFYSFIAELIYL
jgi:hypothetical protein